MLMARRQPRLKLPERTCTVISESNEGTGQKEMSVTQKIGRGLTPAEAAAFQDEWFLQPSKKSGD